jgi:hypothetical protein
VNDETRKFLESLTEEDIEKIRKALRTYTFVEALSWVLRWLVISLLAVAVSITQFGDSIKKIFDWLK